jgi:NADH:ubiquinone oxidoreductase subunit 2 (subunit N)
LLAIEAAIKYLIMGSITIAFFFTWSFISLFFHGYY